MNRQERIRAALEQAFRPERLEVIDESEKHRGHGGWREGGETHYRLRLSAASLTGQSRVAQHRAVNAALAPEFENGLHALAIEIERD